MTAGCSEPLRNSTIDPTLCANCGEAIDGHDPATLPAYAPAEVAMWRWFVANGSLWDPFHRDGANRRRSEAVREHLTRCAVDVDASSAPAATTAEVFVDTASPATPVVLSTGTINCECGELCDLEWSLEGTHTFSDALAGMLEAGTEAPETS